jgi:S1-C subfamily serine protease
VRRAIAAIAVVVLVLASAAVGAAISSAVHSNNNASSNLSASSPLLGGNGSNNGGLGFGNGGSAGPSNTQAPASRSSSTGNPTRALSGIVSKVDPAVVDIYTTINAGGATGQAAGTGMIITPSGEVLTNNHVIDGATNLRVQLVSTGATYSARVIGYDVVDDVALVQVNGVSNLPTVNFADASSVGIGDSIVAIGNALGQGGTPAASAGSVTALDQQVTAGDQTTRNTETLHGMIQIDAPIQPGDSGGPLVNTNGNVIGMNTAGAQSVDFFGQSASTTAFAIPASTALKIAHQIESGTNTTTVHIGERGILGVNIASDNLAANSSGAVIAQVQPNSPADTAGLTAGDAITSLNGKPVTNGADLTALLFPYHPNDRMTVNWIDQSGQQQQRTLQLTAGPPT